MPEPDTDLFSSPVATRLLAHLMAAHPNMVRDVSQYADQLPYAERQRLYRLILREAADLPAAERRDAGILSADEILTQTWPEPPWAVQGLLPVGLTFLAGPPKVGKSWLALQLAMAVASGGAFLGQPAGQGNVLYLALEDSPQRLQKRMLAQRWPAGLPVRFLTVCAIQNQVHDLFAGQCEALCQVIESGQLRLLVVDTLSRAIQGDQQDVQVMTRNLAPIQKAAQDTGCSIVMIDHHRKSSGSGPDAIADILGSTAKGGIADTSWGLYRGRGERSAKLAITGRDVEESLLQVFFDEKQRVWMSDNTPRVHLTEKEVELVLVLNDVGEVTPKQLAEAIGEGTNRGGCYQRLVELEKKGVVEKRGIQWVVSPDFDLSQLDG